jgi:hypothetical protein
MLVFVSMKEKYHHNDEKKPESQGFLSGTHAFSFLRIVFKMLAWIQA